MIFDRLKNNIKSLKVLGVGGWMYYAWYGKTQKEIPRLLARLICRKPFGYSVKIDSYDGSGQCVHPDIVKYMDDLYLAFTPYPYAMDIYENPQLAIWDKKNDSWKTITREPFVKPQNPERFHYSDPFLFVFENKLLYFYRLSDKKNDSKSIIFFVELDAHGHMGGGRQKQFTDSYDHEYTSPFVVGYEGLHFFHIESGVPNKLYVRDFDSFETIIDSSIPLKEVKLEGFDDNEWLWHLGVSSINEYNKKDSEIGWFFGVATYIVDGKYDYYYDALCMLSYDESGWILKKLKELRPDCDKYRYTYKGCVCEMNGKRFAYMTVIDTKFRHGIYCLPLGEICDE